MEVPSWLAVNVYTVALILFVYVQNSNVNEDFLTGICNRRKLLTSLSSAIEDETEPPFAAIMIDIDYLKEINDTYGHVEENSALAEVAKLLKKTFRRGDVVGRYGGDEFCAVASIDQADNLASAIRRRRNNLKIYNDYHHKPYEIQLSCGGALYDRDRKESVEELLTRVDELLYTEKVAHHRERAAQQRGL